MNSRRQDIPLFGDLVQFRTKRVQDFDSFEVVMQHDCEAAAVPQMAVASLFVLQRLLIVLLCNGATAGVVWNVGECRSAIVCN